MKYFKYLLLVFCVAQLSARTMIPPEIDKRIFGYVKEHKKYMREEFEAYCYGVGTGMFDDFAHLSLDYQIKRTVNLKEARKIYVLCHEFLLIRFRSDKEIRPYFHKYPIDKRIISCELSFQEKKSKEKIPSEVDYVHFSRGILKFRSYFPERKLGNSFDTVLEEPYEESLRIVKEEMGEDFPKFGGAKVNGSKYE